MNRRVSKSPARASLYGLTENLIGEGERGKRGGRKEGKEKHSHFHMNVHRDPHIRKPSTVMK